MINVELSESEINAISDLLLFNAIVSDNPEQAVDVVKRFNLNPNHRILNLCEPMSFISQNFLKIYQSGLNSDRNRLSTVSAVSVLEEQIYEEFCKKGIHAIDFCIKIDALSVFHALLDIGHKDYSSDAVHLAIKHLKPDMLGRLKEEGYDLWKENPSWNSRPIDTLSLMISYKDELPTMTFPDLYKNLKECFEIIVKSDSIEKLIEPYSPYGYEGQISENLWSPLRNRESFSQLGNFFYNIVHGLK